jgi:hypothetical protein
LEEFVDIKKELAGEKDWNALNSVAVKTQF